MLVQHPETSLAALLVGVDSKSGAKLHVFSQTPKLLAKKLNCSNFSKWKCNIFLGDALYS
jgi:hypothetical protein